MRDKVSVVIPVYNEEGNILELYNEVKEVCIENNYQYEIIIVNDGSQDRTDELCRHLSPVKYILLRRNFGQTAALDAGIKAANMDYIVTMDGDGQNDPHDIPKILEYMKGNNLDCVSGWRKNRRDNWSKKIVSRVANILRFIIIRDGIHDSGCTLKIYKRECFVGITFFGEQHRFIPALLEIKGYKVGEMVVNHRPRTAGKTKYNFSRMFKGAVDMISVWFWNKYSVRPLHILGTLGLLFIGGGGGCAIWSIILYILGYKMSNNLIPPLLTVFFIILGLLMFIFGLMSEILIKIYYGATVDTTYSIKEIVTNEEFI